MKLTFNVIDNILLSLSFTDRNENYKFKFKVQLLTF